MISYKKFYNHRGIIYKSYRNHRESQRNHRESQTNHRESQTNHRGITVVSQYYLIGFTENYRSQEEKNDELWIMNDDRVTMIWGDELLSYLDICYWVSFHPLQNSLLWQKSTDLTQNISASTWTWWGVDKCF